MLKYNLEKLMKTKNNEMRKLQINSKKRMEDIWYIKIIEEAQRNIKMHFHTEKMEVQFEKNISGKNAGGWKNEKIWDKGI